MRKVDLIRKNMVQSVKNERNILAMANNPFVVGACLRCVCQRACTSAAEQRTPWDGRTRCCLI